MSEKKLPLFDLGHAFALVNEQDAAHDQPCLYGERIGGHAVYCTNHEWVDGPRKCRRTWYTGGEVRDEDCEGFKPNDGSLS